MISFENSITCIKNLISRWISLFFIKQNTSIYFHGGFTSQGHVQDYRSVKVFWDSLFCEFFWQIHLFWGRSFLMSWTAKRWIRTRVCWKNAVSARGSFVSIALPSMKRDAQNQRQGSRRPGEVSELSATHKKWVVSVCVGGVLFIFTIIKE